MSEKRRLGWAEARVAVRCGVLSAACLLSYWLAADVRSQVYYLSHPDGLIGGLWAVIATVFVFRDSYRKSVSAAVSWVEATLVSFTLCLIYLTFLPFRPWALAVLIGVSALTAALIGRPDAAIPAAICTAVLMVSAALNPHDAWQQPVLRLADTIVGVTVGIAAAWAAVRAFGLRPGKPPAKDA